MTSTEIVIARDFSRYPAGRYRSDGPASAEAFRDDHLLPPLKRGEVTSVHLDGVLGFGSSFLDEAFGGLVREHGFTPAQLRETLALQSSDDALTHEVWGYVDAASILSHGR